MRVIPGWELKIIKKPYNQQKVEQNHIVQKQKHAISLQHPDLLEIEHHALFERHEVKMEYLHVLWLQHLTKK